MSMVMGWFAGRLVREEEFKSFITSIGGAKPTGRGVWQDSPVSSFAIS